MVREKLIEIHKRLQQKCPPIRSLMKATNGGSGLSGELDDAIQPSSARFADTMNCRVMDIVRRPNPSYGGGKE